MIPAPQLALLKAAARLPGKGGVEARQVLTTCKIAWNDEPKPASLAAREIPAAFPRTRQRAPLARAITTARGSLREAILWLLLCAMMLIYWDASSTRTLRHTSSSGRRAPTAHTTFTPRRPGSIAASAGRTQIFRREG